MKVIILLTVLLFPLTARGEWPQNYWELPPAQQINVLIVEGGGEYELDKIGKTAALPILHTLLSNYAITDEKKTETVILMLQYFHDEASIDPLMQALKKNAKLEKDVVESISIINWRNNSEKAYLAMMKLLTMPRYMYDEPEFVEQTIMTDLVKSADKSKIPYLIIFLRDKNFPWRSEVIEKLREIGDPPIVIPVIAEVLSDLDPGLRNRAADALGKIGSSLAISPLKNYVKIEKDLHVKLNMAAQLVILGEFCNYSANKSEPI